jgi:hypothetical protein
VKIEKEITNSIKVYKTNKNVKFSPPSINKNDKSDREKNHKYLANRSSNFKNQQIWNQCKNYTGKNLRSIIQTRVRIPKLDKKIEQPKKIEGTTKKE